MGLSSSFLVALFLVSPIVAFASSETVIRLRGGGGDRAGRLYCDSWRLSVETNNAGRWSKVPAACLEHVAEYVGGERYASDSAVVAEDSMAFARTVAIAGDGRDAWVFDVDETLLSNVPYYELNGYGSVAFNETSFDEWVSLARAPALSASLQLYEELQNLGFRIILLTGRGEFQRAATEENLLFEGYSSWETLIMRRSTDHGKPAVIFKSEKRSELEAQGFRIHGSSGDQWSDLLGSSTAARSFKLPNPLYHIP